MIIKKYILSISLILLCFFSNIENAKALSFAEFVYHKARTGDIQTIHKYLYRGYNLDSVDKEGNSALCIAISKNDIFAYRKIKSLGAKTNHPCTKKFKNQKLTTQKSTTKKESIYKSSDDSNTGIYIASGLAVAGIAALAGGGGGGGGSSSDDSNNKNPITCPDGEELVNGKCEQIDCPDGQERVDGICKPIICPEGEELVGNECKPIVCPEGEELVGNECKPIICDEGFTLVGNICEPNVCGENYLSSCNENQYETGNTCLSGNNLLKECLLHTDVPNCKTYSPLEDACAICNDGYTLTGNTCEITICGENYLSSCNENQYETGNTCLSGETLLKECLPHTDVPNCKTYSPTSNTCSECNENYALVGNECLLNTCDEGYTITKDDGCQPTDCGSNYLTLCNENQYETGNTCLSGETLLKECLAHSHVPNCIAYSPTANVCTECNDGYFLQDNVCILIIECPEGFEQSNNICVAVGNTEKENTGDEDLYGVYSTDQDVYNLYSVYVHPDDYQEINLNNTGNGKTIGMYGERHVTNALVDGKRYEDEINPISEATGIINITHQKNGEVYGIYSKILDAQNSWEAVNSEGSDGGIAHGQINITNKGTGKTYGIFGDDRAYNAIAITGGKSYGDINIESYGDIYGIGGYMAAMNATSHQFYLGREAIANINIDSKGNGNIYGINIQKDIKDIESNAQQWIAINAASGGGDYVEGNITIRNKGTGNVYGMYGGQQLWNGLHYGGKTEEGHPTGKAVGTISIINQGNGDVYGMYMPEEDANGVIANITEEGYAHETFGQTGVQSTINLINTGDGITTGLRGGRFNKITNSGIININNLGNGTAIGIYGEAFSKIENSGQINIYRQEYKDEKTNETLTPSSEIGGTAYGIYAENGASVKNSGTITITNASSGKGIYLENDATLENTGTITFNGEEKEAETGDMIDIYGSRTPQSVTNFNDMGKGEVILGATGKFFGDTIKGDLSVTNSPLMDNFENNHTLSNSLKANDLSELNLKSKSAMFNASLVSKDSQNHDVVLTRQNFNNLITNKSVANFLEQNYEEKKNLALYNNLKTASTSSSLNKKIDTLTGNNILPSFRRENQIVHQSLNRQFSDILFNEPNKNYVAGYKFIDISNDSDKSLEESKGTAHSAYGLLKNKTTSGITYGLGASISQLKTDYDDNSKRKSNQFGLWLPFGYDFNNGLKWYSKLHAGYNDNSYDRKTLTGENSADYNEYQFGLNNEVRYTLNLANSLKFEPLAELNLINYYQEDISEKNKENALNIKSNNATSLELGLGSYLTKEFSFDKDKSLKLKIGGIYYVEFLEPDKALKGSIVAMNNNFDIIKKQNSNRGVLSLNATYNYENITLYGNIEKEFGAIDGITIDAGMQYKF